MTVIISVGRRLPRSWFKRTGHFAMGLISFQEHIWTIIKQSLNLAKRKATADGRLNFVMTTDREVEDLNYQIEWLKITIQGTEKQEKEEYEESLQMYSTLGKVLKKEMPKSESMKKHFNSRILSSGKVKEAYEKGYGAMSDNNIASKLLEMGILTHIEWVTDFGSREPEMM